MAFENFANPAHQLEESSSSLSTVVFQQSLLSLSLKISSTASDQQALDGQFGNLRLIDRNEVADSSTHCDKVHHADANHTGYYLGGIKVHETAKERNSVTETNFNAAGLKESSQTTRNDGTTATIFYQADGSKEYQVVQSKAGATVYEYENEFNVASGKMERVAHSVDDKEQRQELIDRARSADFHPPQPFPGSG